MILQDLIQDLAQDLKVNFLARFLKALAKNFEGSTITIKLLYIITYMCQNFGIRDILGQIP